MWRLVWESKGGITYDDVFNQMTPDEIQEANASLDLYAEAVRRAEKRAQRAR